MSKVTLLIGFAVLGVGHGLRGQPADVVPLTEGEQVRALPRADAARGLPVRLRGVITFVSTYSFVVADGSGTWIRLRQPLPVAVRPGERVEIEGRTDEGHFAPVVFATTVTRLGSAPLPRPVELTAPAMRSGELDCRRVRITGVVRGRVPVEAGDAHTTSFILSTPLGQIPLQLFATDAEMGAELLDAEVEATGVCLTFFNARGQAQGVRLAANSLDEFKVIRPARGGPFDAPAIALRDVMRFSPDGRNLHRRRVTGTVTFSESGNFFFLQEGAHALRVNTRQPGGLQPGDRVEAAGFLDSVHNKARLMESVFRRIGPGEPLEPIEITVGQALHPNRFPVAGEYPDFDDRWIALRGRLLTVEGQRGERVQLNLECDDGLVPVEVADGADFDRLRAFAPGSELRVRGVCALAFSESAPVLAWPRPIGMRVLVRGADDIEVLQHAPWWTAGRLWTALAVSATVLIGAALWIVLLRRTVARRSRQLASEMQARHGAAVEFESTLRERTRLAADLHDTLEQSLTGLAFQLEAGDALLETNLERSRHHLGLGQHLLSRSREDLRRSIWNLRSTALEEGSLLEALQRIAASRGSSTDTRIDVEWTGEPRPISELIAGNLLLLAQEAITNALKHASATRITVNLSFVENSLALQIRDDGTGFNLHEAAGPMTGHFGLQGMRERIKRLGGTLEIASAPAKGTRIAATVPC